MLGVDKIRGDSADPLSRGLFDQRGQSASGRVACDVPEDLRTGATEFVYERRTLMRIFEDLQALGCEGGDAVRRHASRRAKVREHYGKPESQISTGDCIREY